MVMQLVSNDLAIQYSKAIDRVIYDKLKELPDKLIELGEHDLAEEFANQLKRDTFYKGHSIKQLLETRGYEIKIVYPEPKFDTLDNVMKATTNFEDMKIILKKNMVEI